MTAITKSPYQFLNFSKFQKLNFWDYYTLSNKANIFSNFPLVELGTVLKQRKESFVIDDTKTYKRCRVQLYGNGVVLRDEVLGKEIKTKKQQPCKANDFLVAEIDAKFGGYGIVPHELEDAIVSSHYFLFEINAKKLLPEYLGLVVKCNDFSKQVKATGSTNYAAIRPYHVLNYLIPLPSLEEQNQIVEAYNKRIAEAERLENEAKQLEEGIENYVFSKLGLSKDSKDYAINTKKLSFVKFKNINVWATWNIRNAYISQKYPSVNLGEILSMSSGMFLPAKNQKTGEYLVYGGNGINGTHDTYIHEGQRIIIGRVGEKCGNIHLVDGHYWVTDNSFITKKINEDFLLEYLAIVLSRLDLNRFKVISAQPSISQKNIVSVPVPFAPLSVQKEIINSANNIRTEIESLKKKSEAQRQQAITEFESKIFMPCN